MTIVKSSVVPSPSIKPPHVQIHIHRIKKPLGHNPSFLTFTLQLLYMPIHLSPSRIRTSWTSKYHGLGAQQAVHPIITSFLVIHLLSFTSFNKSLN